MSDAEVTYQVDVALREGVSAYRDLYALLSSPKDEQVTAEATATCAEAAFSLTALSRELQRQQELSPERLELIRDLAESFLLLSAAGPGLDVIALPLVTPAAVSERAEALGVPA
jgi:hypothetical protein